MEQTDTTPEDVNNDVGEAASPEPMQPKTKYKKDGAYCCVPGSNEIPMGVKIGIQRAPQRIFLYIKHRKLRQFLVTLGFVSIHLNWLQLS